MAKERVRRQPDKSDLQKRFENLSQDQLDSELKRYKTYDGEQEKIAKFKTSPRTQTNTIRNSARARKLPEKEMNELNSVLSKWTHKDQKTAVATLWNKFLAKRRNAINAEKNRRQMAEKAEARKQAAAEAMKRQEDNQKEITNTIKEMRKLETEINKTDLMAVDKEILDKWMSDMAGQHGTIERLCKDMFGEYSLEQFPQGEFRAQLGQAIATDWPKLLERGTRVGKEINRRAQLTARAKLREEVERNEQ